MRYKFRGKRLDGQGWVYGDLIRHYENQRRFIALDQMAYTYTENGISRLVSERYHEVLPDSVGQWTGLVDRHGEEIYEGDIVILETVSRHRSLGCVRWTDFARYEFWHLRQDQGFQLGQRFDETEIIGNIHDNPELMEV